MTNVFERDETRTARQIGLLESLKLLGAYRDFRICSPPPPPFFSTSHPPPPLSTHPSYSSLPTSDTHVPPHLSHTHTYPPHTQTPFPNQSPTPCIINRFCMALQSAELPAVNAHTRLGGMLRIHQPTSSGCTGDSPPA